MRKMLLIFVGFMLVVTIVMPTVIVRGCSLAPAPSQTGSVDSGLSLRVFVTAEQKTVEMDLEEYVKGVVAAEMPANFAPAALEAQALVARTFAVRRMRILGGSGCALHADADICTDPTHDQGWASAGELRKNWGIFNYYRYWGKISSAVAATAGQIITYDGVPIDPVYHSTCAGHTENSEDVWSNAVPYLRGVVCETDGDSPRLKEERDFTLSQLEQAIGAGAGTLAAMKRGSAKVVEVLSATPYGRVKQVRIGDQTLTGTELRSALSLRSTKLTLSWNGDRLHVVSQGYGHGVGLCQYGAGGMAKLGLTADEIVKHYYTGVEIAPLTED